MNTLSGEVKVKGGEPMQPIVRYRSDVGPLLVTVTAQVMQWPPDFRPYLNIEYGDRWAMVRCYLDLTPQFRKTLLASEVSIYAGADPTPTVQPAGLVVVALALLKKGETPAVMPLVRSYICDLGVGQEQEFEVPAFVKSLSVEPSPIELGVRRAMPIWDTSSKMELVMRAPGRAVRSRCAVDWLAFFQGKTLSLAADVTTVQLVNTDTRPIAARVVFHVNL